jgi:Holliday junction DNA helicase RuvA
MIGMLKGTLVYKSDPYLLVDVSGVGYKVLVPRNILQKGVVGDTLQLFTYTHVREDALELYGFSEVEDLRLFEMLISVSGVGCKSGLGVFSAGTRSEIITAILQNNVAFFQSVPRLGKKNAQKIIIDLKGKVGEGEEFSLTEGGGEDAEEVLEALKGFGFTTKEAFGAMHSVAQDGLSTEERIKLALKYLGK